MTRNRLAWITSKVVVFAFIAASVPQGTLRIFQDLRAAGVDLSTALMILGFILAMCSGGATLIWHLLFRNDPYRKKI